MGFGNKLKDILKKRGITIKELSEMTGISINTLYSITKRDTQNPSKEIINKISSALQVDSSELYTLEMITSELNDYIEQLKNSEQTLRDRLYEITERLNVDALMELINNALKLLQDDIYHSYFYKE